MIICMILFFRTKGYVVLMCVKKKPYVQNIHARFSLCLKYYYQILIVFIYMQILIESIRLGIWIKVQFLYSLSLSLDLETFALPPKSIKLLTFPLNQTLKAIIWEHIFLYNNSGLSFLHLVQYQHIDTSLSKDNCFFFLLVED